MHNWANVNMKTEVSLLFQVNLGYLLGNVYTVSDKLSHSKIICSHRS